MIIVNDAPVVTILQPANDASFDSGIAIDFEGTANDTEDGDLTASLVWTSDLDGQIGSGGSFSTTLSDGNHVITVEVTDSNGESGSDSVNITVGTQSDPVSVSVTSITYNAEGGRNGDRHLLITVALVDDIGSPVEGLSVSIEVSHNSSLYFSGTGTTGADGTVTFKLPNAPSGTYTTTITNVSDDGWDGVTPENEFIKS